jgi:glycosyltransferase involved in cell wall biosynthesis
LAYPRAAAVVAPNARCLETLVTVAPARRRVVPNPVLTTSAADSSSEPVSRRSVIVALGRLVALKGFDMLIRAFAAIADETPGWSLEIHGEGPERATLEALVRTLGVGERVRLPGFTRDPRAVLAGAGIFALSSRLEGSPNALADAMACGVAVVAFDCEAGPRELIREGEDGLLVPAGDVVALADALRDLAYDSGLRKRLGDKARDIARRFAPDDIAVQWETLLLEAAIGLSAETPPHGVSSAGGKT